MEKSNNLRQEFIEYAKNCILSRRPSSKSDFIIGQNAVDSYVLFLEVDKLFSYNPEKWKDIRSIFDIDSSERIKEIYLELVGDDEFNKVDSQQASQYFRSNAIKHYYCFLRAREIILGKTETQHTIVEESPKSSQRNGNQSRQQIFYGAPGTGKSYTINRDTAGEDVIRTTFHPDTDYSTFVGAYKPTTIEEEVMTVVGTKAVPVENADGTHRKESKIVYEFVPQAFLQAYVAAWKKYAEAQDGKTRKQFLVIEEINRGNCAQIFGDLFQLLDRNAQGFSDYPITADADMKRQLKKAFAGLTLADGDNINAMYNGRNVCQEVLEGDILLLPNNLYIWATMNTSDQSLFPIDSAFKRRWDWQYMPISEGRDKNGQSKNWKIEADTQMYSWWSFIQKINDEIYDKTYSEDKELGYYFCKPINDVIKVETFVSKVLFYLWNDVFKDFDNESGIFAEPYDKFYGTDTKGEVVIAKDKVQTLLDNLHVEVAEIIGADENESASDESDNTTKTGSSARDKSVYAINGEGNYVKKNVPLATVTAYVKNYPDVTASELVETWYALGTMVRQIVISKESYEQKLSKTSDANFATRYDSLNLPNGEVVYVYNQFTPERINDFISKVNEQSWDIHIKKVSE